MKLRFGARSWLTAAKIVIALLSDPSWWLQFGYSPRSPQKRGSSF
jgi:hypothetical protein